MSKIKSGYIIIYSPAKINFTQELLQIPQSKITMDVISNYEILLANVKNKNPDAILLLHNNESSKIVMQLRKESLIDQIPLFVTTSLEEAVQFVNHYEDVIMH